MKVEIKLSADIHEPYAVIYADSINDEIQKAVIALESGENVITAKSGERIVLLRANEIHMIRAEAEKIFIYTKTDKYLSNRRLYEFETMLGTGFIRISKSVLVNLKQISSVEASFNSMMLLIMKNSEKDYISRKYLPAFKKRLGL